MFIAALVFLCFSQTALPLQLLILTPSLYPTSAQNMLWQLNRVSFLITNRLLPKTPKHFAKWLFFVEDIVFNINYNSVQYCNTQVAIVGKNTMFSECGSAFPKPLCLKDIFLCSCPLSWTAFNATNKRRHNGTEMYRDTTYRPTGKQPALSPFFLSYFLHPSFPFFPSLFFLPFPILLSFLNSTSFFCFSKEKLLMVQFVSPLYLLCK